MKAGKVSISELKELVLDKIETRNPETLVGPMVGEDSAVLDCGEFVMVVSTDPITGVEAGMGSLAVNVACNDIAANGARPIGIQQVLLIPPETSQEEMVAVVEDINQAAQELGVDILGGHTEVTEVVNKPLVSCTALGKAGHDEYVTSGGAKPGDKVIVTKWTGLEGTSILATDFYAQLVEAGVEESLLKAAQELAEDISVIPEGMLGAELGVNAMHDVTEGGLYGSLYELAEAAEVGFIINEEQVPVHDTTQAVTEALELNPYQLIGSGMMILTTPEGEELVAELAQKGIKSTVIGTITTDKRIINQPVGSRQLTSVPEDELWRILED